MFLSIIIPVYNVEKYVRKCILSCMAIEKFCNSFEIIIVNDGTKDHSMSVINSVVQGKSNIHILNKENGGLSSARNAGLKMAHGEYVWFVDSDDWIDSEEVVNALSLLKSVRPDIFQFDFLMAYDDGSLKVKYQSSFNGNVSGRDLIRDKQTSVAVQFAMYRRDFLIDNDLSFINGIYHEDVEFKPRALYLASSVYYHHKVLYYYYQRSSGSIMSHLKLKHAQDSLTIAKSFMQFIQQNQMNKADKIIFYNKISAALVYMVRVAKSLNDDVEVKQILRLLSENKKLLSKMLLSCNLKYILLGFLMLLSPRLVYSVAPGKH